MTDLCDLQQNFQRGFDLLGTGRTGRTAGVRSDENWFLLRLFRDVTVYVFIPFCYRNLHDILPFSEN